MYNPNFGYPSSSSHQQSTSLPFSSTPSNFRSSRPPRFGFSGPGAYPRPRSSASKPNPDIYPESIRDQYGNTDDYLDNLSTKYPVPSEYGDSEDYERRNNYGDATENYMDSTIRNVYGNASDNPMNTPPRSSYGNVEAYVGVSRGTTDSMINNYGNTNNRSMDISFPSMNNSYYSYDNSSTISPSNSAYYTCNESFYESPKKPLISGHTPVFPPQSSPSKFLLKNSGLQGRFQNKRDTFKANSLLGKKPKFIFNSKRGPGKKNMASKGEWRCTVCSIEFTSGIPYDMHLRGAKHAKKLKLQGALVSIQSQAAENKEIAPVGNSFRCELCNITANSSLQLQTHLIGTKHKNKLTQQLQPKEQKSDEKSEVNGKSNGAAMVRSLPMEFGEPQQAKMCKFSCDTCNVVVNSEIQLQQHLTSKKHQAKVEGKPLQKKKRKKDDDNEEKMDDNTARGSVAADVTSQEFATSDTTETSNTSDTRKMVVGVKTLSASFVQGDTLG